MATNYPSSLDDFTNPTADDSLNSDTVPHADQHANLNDAVEALQAKVGADSSAVATSHDYKIAQLESRSKTNLVMNGAMQVAQRGTSVASISTTGFYTVDRFRYGASSSSVWTQSQASDGPAGFANSLKMECTTAQSSPGAADYAQIFYAFEGQDLQSWKKGTASAQQVTLSFWVKSSTTGTYCVELYDVDNTRWTDQQYTVSSADTWEYKTVTFAADTTGALDDDNGFSIALSFWLMSGSDFSSGTLGTTWNTTHANRAVGQTNLAATTSNYWQITGVQLEIGSDATDFQHLLFGDELVRCQRYFEKSFNYGTAPAHNTGGMGIHNNCGSLGCGGNTYGRLDFAVSKRASPTMRIYDMLASHPANENWWRTYGGCTGGTPSSTGFSWTFYENYGSGYCQYASDAAYGFEWTAEAEL